jgi:hypothetical protein
VLWTDSAAVRLGVLDGDGAATAVNDAGMVVGWVRDSSGELRAVAWDFSRDAVEG